MEMIGRLKERIEQGYRLGYDEALELLRTTPETELCALAHALRTRYQGKTIDMCSIMNARSGRCSEDCKWCAQSKFHKTEVEVYPLVGAREAVEEAAGNARKGVKRFSLVTSGRTLSDADTDRICAIYRRIGSEVSVSLCASLGLLNLEQMRRLKESGVRRYHCNLETAPSYFPKLCSTHTVAEKLRTIGWAREAGLEICSGGIIGMGESEEQRVEFAIALRQTGGGFDSRQRVESDSRNAACRGAAADRFGNRSGGGRHADPQSRSGYPAGRRPYADQASRRAVVAVRRERADRRRYADYDRIGYRNR